MPRRARRTSIGRPLEPDGTPFSVQGQPDGWVTLVAWKGGTGYYAEIAGWLDRDTLLLFAMDHLGSSISNRSMSSPDFIGGRRR